MTDTAPGVQRFFADPRTDPWRAALWLVGGFLLIRLVALFATPLELYPDEAQYWLWSRELAFGYYSKPPMIAWLIWLTTAIGGDSEPVVRLSSPILHAGTALVLFAIGRRLYTPWTGFVAALLYTLMPGVQLSSGIVTTDAPLLFCLSLALLAYVSGLDATEARRRLLRGAGLGAALGLAFLSKYAALYALIGLAAHAATDAGARRFWLSRAGAAALVAFAVIVGPNLAWNASHGFATVSHTAANANWNADSLINPGSALSFVAEQTAVFGPVPFVALLIGLWLLIRARGRGEAADRLLLCFVLPPLIVVTVQAFLSRANANWAAAAYVGAAPLVAAWLLRWNARRWLAGGVALQALIAAVFLVAAVSPAASEALGVANSFKRAKGWEESARRILARAEAESRAGPLQAIAVDDRFLFNSLAYYGRDWFSRAGAPPLKAWVREAVPQNQAETFAPLSAGETGRVLIASVVPEYRREIVWDFARVVGVQDAPVRLDRKRTRDLQLFVAEGYDRRPRDPVSGLPTPP